MRLKLVGLKLVVTVESLAEVGGLGPDEQVVLVQDLVFGQLLVAVGVGLENLEREWISLREKKLKQTLKFNSKAYTVQLNTFYESFETVSTR